MTIISRAPLGDTLMFSPIIDQVWRMTGQKVNLGLKHKDIYLDDFRVSLDSRDNDIRKISYVPQNERDNSTHYIDWFAKCVGVEIQNKELSIQISIQNEVYLEKSDHRTLAVCTGAGSPTRRYNKYNETCRILRKAGWRIVELGVSGAGESLSEKDISYLGKLTVLQSASVIRQCDAFLGADSLCYHLASAVNVPAFTIFSTENPILLMHKQTIPIVAAKCIKCYGIWNRKYCHHDLANNERLSCLDISPEYIASLILER